MFSSNIFIKYQKNLKARKLIDYSSKSNLETNLLAML